MTAALYQVEVVVLDVPPRRTAIGPATKDPLEARRRALGVRETERRRAVILKNGRQLGNGAHALDDIAYARWLEDNQPVASP